MAELLVIDDDRALRTLMGATLVDHGFSVRLAKNGREALEACSRSMPDAIVLDLELPEMDGRRFLEALRRKGDPPPVVLITAHRAQAAADELGLPRWLQKPFDERRLAEMVSAALSDD